ncbi:MFS transporter [Pseudoduganella sp. UC29_106]|uniref:MFS transporter n=1 Tax=Pseudoduganella sp. UC29_106 TaxID=3374553 RepID=UPI00375729DA
MNNILLIAATCLLALLSTVGASLPYPILPPLFAGDAPNALNNFLGLPPKLLFGIALTINPIGLLIGTALTGPLSDRFGRRPLLLVTALGAAVGHALTAAALVAQSYPLFVLARFVTGLLEGNAAVARALIAERLEGPLRLRALSLVNGALHLGWLVGPVMAGFTLGFGIAVPFLAAVAALVLAAVLVAVTVPRQEAAAEGPSWWQVARDRHVVKLLRHTDLRTLFIIQLAATCGVTAFYEYYPLWLVEQGGYDARGIATTNMALCAIMTLAAVIAGRPSKADPLKRASVFALLVGAAVAGVALGNMWTGLVAIALFGIPNAFYNATLQAWCAERFAAHGQGAVMGLLSMTFCFANILMALAGSVLTLADTRLILVLGAVLSIWAGWRLRGWRGELAPSPAGAKANENVTGASI